jgi:CRP-like cAMP-binding protein
VAKPIGSQNPAECGDEGNGGPVARPITHSLIKALKNVPGFDVLDDRTLLRIVGASVNLSWPAGSRVFEKGNPGEALYIVLSGQVRIYDVVDGQEVEVARTRPGDYFGEMSLLLTSTHTKSVQAVEESELLVLMKESFQKLLDSYPEVAEIVHRRLRDRLPERHVEETEVGVAELGAGP